MGKSLRAAINAKCVECCCGSKVEVKRCAITACPLWEVRPFQPKQRHKSGGPVPDGLRRWMREKVTQIAERKSPESNLVGVGAD